MLSPARLGAIWRILFAGFLLTFSTSIALSQIFLGLSAIFFFIDAWSTQNFRFTDGEKTLYVIAGTFFLWNVLCGAVNGSPFQSMIAMRDEWLFLATLLAARAFADSAWRPRLVGCALVGVGAIALLGWWQAWHGQTFAVERALTITVDGHFRAAGFFHNTMTYGNAMCVCAVFFLSVSALITLRRAQIEAAIVGVAAAGATILSYTRGAILALAVGTIVAVAILPPRKRLYGFLALMIAVVTIALAAPGIRARLDEAYRAETGHAESQRANENSRLAIWGTSWRIVERNPVFGVGPGNFSAAYAAEKGSETALTFGHAHNDVLHAAAQGGIPGATLFLAIWIYVIRHFLKTRRRPDLSNEGRALVNAALCASLTFFAASLTEATFVDEEVRVVLMLVWGIGFWASDIDARSKLLATAA